MLLLALPPQRALGLVEVGIALRGPKLLVVAVVLIVFVFVALTLASHVLIALARVFALGVSFGAFSLNLTDVHGYNTIPSLNGASIALDVGSEVGVGGVAFQIQEEIRGDPCRSHV